jgi:hypothetical protein
VSNLVAAHRHPRESRARLLPVIRCDGREPRAALVTDEIDARAVLPHNLSRAIDEGCRRLQLLERADQVDAEHVKLTLQAQRFSLCSHALIGGPPGVTAIGR